MYGSTCTAQADGSLERTVALVLRRAGWVDSLEGLKKTKRLASGRLDMAGATLVAAERTGD